MADTDTLHYAVKEAVKDAVIALGLTGSPDADFNLGGRVFNQPVEDLSNVMTPFVIVTHPKGGSEEEAGGTTEHRSHWYPVWVFVVDRESTRYKEKEATYLAWRKAIKDRFDWKRLLVSASIGSLFGEARMGLVIDPRHDLYQYVRTGLSLKFFTTERRPA